MSKMPKEITGFENIIDAISEDIPGMSPEAFEEELAAMPRSERNRLDLISKRISEQTDRLESYFETASAAKPRFRRRGGYIEAEPK